MPPTGSNIPFPEITRLDAPATASPRAAAELALVRQQAGRVGQRVSAAGWHVSQLNQLLRRRSGVTGARNMPPSFSILPANGRVVLSADYLLVRTADFLRSSPAAAPATAPAAPSMRQLLTQFEPYDHQLADAPGTVDPQDPATDGLLDGRLIRVDFPQRTGPELMPVVQVLRANGFAASIGHVVPLNVILKIKGAIRATTRSLEFPPPWAESGAPVTVAVIDTGIEAAHRTDGWLQGIEDAANADPLDAFPLPPAQPDHFLDFAAGHGTFVAGIIAQVSPTSTVTIYRRVDSDGVGAEVDVAMALVEAARDGAQIINLSLGTDTTDNRPPLALSTALDILREQHPEVVVVAAAGNTGTDTEAWPAAFKNVVAVAALSADLEPAPWSNRGQWIDFATVGQGIVSTFVPGRQPPDPVTDEPGDTFAAGHPWGVGTGTSFAAPQIAGAIARLLQRGHGGDPARPIRSAGEAVAHLRSVGAYRPDFGYTLKILDGTAT